MTHGLKGALLLSLAVGCSAGGDKIDLINHLDGGDASNDGSVDLGTAFDADAATDGDVFVGDPKTCAHAAIAHTYVGCDFFPTALPNVVGTYFDFAVIVANAGETSASVTIELGGKTVQTGDVPPNSLKKFFLPWTDSKVFMGKCDTDSLISLTTNKRTPNAAYHLTASVPVTVFQFNPLEYQAKGGPAGKDWAECNKRCIFGCKSYSNDASLLLPTTAMTGNYRVTGTPSIKTTEITNSTYVTVTGVTDGTKVRLKTGAKGTIMAGAGVPGTSPFGVLDFTIGRGEVVTLVASTDGDLAGTLVQADKPVQVFAGIPCTYIPTDRQACDHLEESVFPAETLGKRYFVADPTTPSGGTKGHVVRLVGNVDGTKLTFNGAVPPKAPATIDAGQVVDLGIVEGGFEIVADHELAVTAFMLGGTIVDGFGGRGDPSQTNFAAVEQYRKKYVFLAPDDYDVSYADVVVPDGASVTIDGVKIPGAKAIASGYGVSRVKLGPGAGGAHVLVSDQPVGLQVMGYGFATSYHYPGGLDLKNIAPPPPTIK